MKTTALLLLGTISVLFLTPGCGPPGKEIGPPRLHVDRLESPTGLEALDAPGDTGGAITLTWKTSPTENTPDFMIRNEIHRRQFKAGITQTERNRIHEEVYARYGKEPAIEYRIHSPIPYEGLMSLLAGLHQVDRTRVEEGWHDFRKAWKKARHENRLGLILGLARLGHNIKNTAPPAAWITDLAAWRQTGTIEALPPLLRKHLLPGEHLSGRLHACALALLPPAGHRGDLFLEENLEEALLACFGDPSMYEKYLDNLEKNTAWGVLATFSSGINFEKKDSSSCEFRESGGDRHFFTVKNLVDGLPHRFRVDLVMGDQVVPVKALHANGPPEPGIVSAVSRPNWFMTGKLNLLIGVVILALIILLFIHRARRNPGMFIRRIDGLKAVDRAISRALEKGKPIYYIMGIGAIDELPTIASVSILERIAKQAVKKDLRILVPCYDPVVMSVAQDVIHTAYEEAGKLDRYVKEDVFFVTADQFSYAASVDGMLTRDRPSTSFLLGLFASESLLLSEVGSSIGAVQISGTDQPAQIPFFITTTDYTLIGEELYAANAYLSRNPLQLGSLRGQDVGKVLLGVLIITGAVLGTFGVDVIWRILS